MVLSEAAVENLENRIDKICRKYGLPYLDNEVNENSKEMTPIEELFKEDTKIIEGNNRHEPLMRAWSL